MAVFARSPQPLALTTVHARIIFAVTIVCVIIATFTVVLRIYARHLKQKTHVLEDYLIFVALFAFYVQASLTCIAVILGGAGHPQSTISPETVTLSLRLLAGQGVCYGTAIACSKCSICLLYRRIFVLRPFRLATNLLMILVVGWGTFASVVTWGFCVPIAFNWDRTIPGGHCANREAGYMVVGIVDTITDFLILILPLPVIWHLHVSKLNKVGLCIIFSIVIISIIVAGLRAKYTTIVTFIDFTDSMTLLHIFSSIEPSTSIIVASSLILKPVLQKCFRSDSRTASSSAKHSFHHINQYTGTALRRIQLRQPKAAMLAPIGTAKGQVSSHDSEDIECASSLENNGMREYAEIMAAEGEIRVQREFRIDSEIPRSHI